MKKSKLATYTNIANNYGGRRLYKVSKIAIHHMAGRMTARQCADYFARTDRIASSNYTIGWDGSIALSVPEEYRAYTTSSSWCDERAITIEVSNEDNNGGDWKITDKAYNALLDLVTDICRRYNIKDCSYTGDKDGVLQKHEWYAWTNCPGAYLGSKFPEISRIVNQRLKSKTIDLTNKNKGNLAKITVSALNVRKEPNDKSKIVTVVKKNEVYTITDVKGNWGKLKSGTGWIYLPMTDFSNYPVDLTNSIGLYKFKTDTNIRYNPSTRSNVKRVAIKNSMVSITEIKNGWAKISNKDEWFWLKLATQIKEFNVDVKKYTNVREKASINSKIVDIFIKVKSTKIKEVKNGWGLINSKKGWIWLGLTSLKK